MTNNIVLKDIIGYAGAKEIIDTFKFSGDWEIDHIKLSNKLQSHYCDTVGVYNNNIEKAIERNVNEIIMAHYTEINFVVDHYGVLFEDDSI